MARREEQETHLSITMEGGSTWMAVTRILLERSPAGAREPGGGHTRKSGRGGWRSTDPHAPASCLTELRWQHTHGETGAAKRQTRCPWQFIGGTFQKHPSAIFASVKVMQWGRKTLMSANPGSPHRLCHILLCEQGVHHL